MKHIPRLLMIFAAVALASLFVFPMWQISLFAPQYPDGVTMHIYIDKIGGTSPGTLQNVNILNHYVGMKEIVPDAIPELQYFPYIIGGLIFLALLTTLPNQSKYYLAWGILLVIISILGFYDFYLWEYDYGHDLSPTAPIVIPGASFSATFDWEENDSQLYGIFLTTYWRVDGWCRHAEQFSRLFLRHRSRPQLILEQVSTSGSKKLSKAI